MTWELRGNFIRLYVIKAASFMIFAIYQGVSTFCLQYKYQISIDGTVAAYRLPYLLGGSGVVLKQDSSYYEFFYHDLEPHVHYIPFKRDLSDLIEKVSQYMALY